MMICTGGWGLRLKNSHRSNSFLFFVFFVPKKTPCSLWPLLNNCKFTFAY